MNTKTLICLVCSAFLAANGCATKEKPAPNTHIPGNVLGNEKMLAALVSAGIGIPVNVTNASSNAFSIKLTPSHTQ